MSTIRDGYLLFKQFKTYFKVVGNPKKTPLLVLHGGPGSAHNYLLGLTELAKDRQVIFYDQLGGGLSDHPDDDGLWSFTLFLDELKTVRTYLDLPEVHLLGHSWGGMLAIEYLLGKHESVKSVVLSSAMVSMPLYQREVDLLKADLPGNLYHVMLRHELAGTTDSAEYKGAMDVYNARHIFRGKHWPPRYSAPEGSFGTRPYELLWGVSEACANGKLQDWDRLSRLSEITIPTLITSGQYDELTPAQAVATQQAIPESELQIFTAAAHMHPLEREADYVATVADFLKRAD